LPLPQLCAHTVITALIYLLLLLGIQSVENEEILWFKSIFTPKK